MERGKRLLRNENDWNRWLIEAFQDVFGSEEDESREEMKSDHHPKSFPVTITWYATRARFDWFHFEMIYPEDIS